MADTASNGPQGAGAVQFMMANKLDTAMWLSRLFTVYCSALFVLPLLGLHEAASFYQRALLANALTSALRLHQRLPHFQLSRAFLAQALLEDSCHYLLYSLIFVNSYPVTMSIFPVLLFSLLHAATYTKKVLDAKGSNSLPLLRSMLDKLSANQQNILKFIACNEIFLMPATVFMLFSGQGSLLQPFIYYRFLTLRYSSRRNPYCRLMPLRDSLWLVGASVTSVGPSCRRAWESKFQPSALGRWIHMVGNSPDTDVRSKYAEQTKNMINVLH
ncbi:transmembrane protein 33 isoform X3 [Manis javanica]|uniref:transmembrane protein 33 isoform X3 n=2 Tax=Manis javanica TaxID=9974 RepID=UPI003C6D5A8A